jgi:hypothetical protein
MKNYRRIKGSKVEPLIKAAIALNEKMQGCYYWHPDCHASGRRRNEQRNSMDFSFRFEGRDYSVVLTTRESCKHVYFRRDIRVDGAKKDIRALKKLVNG